MGVPFVLGSRSRILLFRMSGSTKTAKTNGKSSFTSVLDALTHPPITSAQNAGFNRFAVTSGRSVQIGNIHLNQVLKIWMPADFLRIREVVTAPSYHVLFLKSNFNMNVWAFINVMCHIKSLSPVFLHL